MAKAAYVVRKMSVFDIVEEAKSIIDDLGSDVRDVVDNASESSSATERIQTLGETADVLEGAEWPDVPEHLEDLKLVCQSPLDFSKSKKPSRAAQRDWAEHMLRVLGEKMEAMVQPHADQNPEDDEGREEMQEFAEALSALADEISGCEFPGFGKSG